jgi:cell division transport system permease protein
MRLFFYFFKEALRGFYHAKLMTFASIISIGASLFFMSIVAISFINIQTVIKNTADQADIAAYLTDKVADNQVAVAELIEKIDAFQQVEKAVLIGKDSAWGRFSTMYGSEILNAVDENPLPATLEIFLNDQYQSNTGAKDLELKLQQMEGIESVRCSREWIDLIERFSRYFFFASIVLILILVIVLPFMVSNTIKLTIYARKELVSNMHFVGATRFFISMPFLMEGMLQGFIGGLMCVFFLGFLRLVLSNLAIVWGFNYFTLTILLFGVIFGWFGSYTAVRKFLA